MAMTSATATERSAAEFGGELRAELARVDEELRAFVKDRPILALLGALTVGYLAGRVLRGRV